MKTFYSLWLTVVWIVASSTLPRTLTRDAGLLAFQGTTFLYIIGQAIIHFCFHKDKTQ